MSAVLLRGGRWAVINVLDTAGGCVRDRSGIEYGSEALVELWRWGFVADAEKHQRLSEPG